MDVIARLHNTIAAVCPIDGVSGSQGNIRIDFQAVATAAQRTAAQNALASFDWSAAADTAYRDAQEPDLSAMRDNATAAFNTNATYIALAAPSTAQNTAQIKALSQQMQKIIKALARLSIKAL